MRLPSPKEPIDVLVRETILAVIGTHIRPRPQAREEATMPQDWNGPPAPDESGNIAVGGFNDFLKNHPDLRRSPVRATIKFVKLRDPAALKTRIRAQASQLENPQETRVILTEIGLPDDSVQAVRWALDFRRAGDRWRLESARRTQRCQPGRGHQGFSPRPCK